MKDERSFPELFLVDVVASTHGREDGREGGRRQRQLLVN